jgi:hypothetical protein
MTTDNSEHPRSTASETKPVESGNETKAELTRLHQTFDGHERNRDRMALLAFEVFAIRT